MNSADGRRTGSESGRERRPQLHFAGLRVQMVLRDDLIEAVTVDRQENGPAPRTGFERELVDHLRGRLQGDRPVRWDRLRLDDCTEFSRSVYEAVSAVPAGTTVTYGELARRIGTEGAAQAVGQALGSNPVPLIVPCHRVTRANGDSGGFGGEDPSPVKSHLIRLEKQWTNP